MKTKSSVLGKAVRWALYAMVALMLVASVSAFRESVLLGMALVVIPAIFFAAIFFRAIAKSIWAVAFLMFSVGVLEIYSGFAKGMPIAWVLGGAVFFLVIIWSFVKAATGAYKNAFPKGDLPFPKVSPITHSFDSAFGNMRKRADSSRPNTNETGLGEDGFNGRGGVHEMFREGDAFGEF